MAEDHQQWPASSSSSNVIFRGWRLPPRRWKEWVERLAPKHAHIWVQAGIYNAVMNSVYEVKCCPELILGLSEYWCSGTNTFVFPWGEATITLEDVMILGGYSVRGECVSTSTTDPYSRPSSTSSSEDQLMRKIEEKLQKYRTQVQRGRANKASQGEWIKFFMDKKGKYEHAAFLALWLSRFLFTAFSGDLVVKKVFPVAAKLSQGVKVALGPAVLASLYRDLRKLSEELEVAANSSFSSQTKIVLQEPFQLLHIWALERFPILVPAETPSSLQPGTEQRVARWHRLKLKLNLPIVRFALESTETFRCPPYAAKGNFDSITPDMPSEIRNQIVQDWSDDDELQPVPVIRANPSHVPTSAAVSSRKHKEPIAQSFSNSDDSEASYDDDAFIATMRRKPCLGSSAAARPKSDPITAASGRSKRKFYQNEGTSRNDSVTSPSSVKDAAVPESEVKRENLGTESTESSDLAGKAALNIEADHCLEEEDNIRTDHPHERDEAHEEWQQLLPRAPSADLERGSRMAGNSCDDPLIID